MGVLIDDVTYERMISRLNYLKDASKQHYRRYYIITDEDTEEEIKAKKELRAIRAERARINYHKRKQKKKEEKLKQKQLEASSN